MGHFYLRYMSMKVAKVRQGSKKKRAQKRITKNCDSMILIVIEAPKRQYTYLKKKVNEG